MKIFLSPLAAKKLELLLIYLEKEWSLEVRNDFIKKVKEKLKQISLYPKSCLKTSEFPNLYKCIVTKQTSLYYRIIKNEIEIITITDNRQDPEKVFTEIKKYFA